MRRRRAARDGRPGRTRSNVTAAPRPRLRECCLGNLARSVRPTRASCKSHCKEQVGNNEIEPAVVSYSQRLVLRSAKMPVGFVSPKCAAPLALMLSNHYVVSAEDLQEVPRATTVLTKMRSLR